MKKRLGLVLMSACMAFAQTPNFSGVWQADLQKSKLGGGPPPKSYTIIIDQDGTKLTETTGVVGERGEHRSSFTYDVSGAVSRNRRDGMPMETKPALSGNTLTLESKVAALPHPGAMTETWTLSPDGKTLTIASTAKIGDREQAQTVVLDKQPDAAGADLRKPEELAGTHNKNVLLLKNLPQSQFIDTMRYFSASLGVRCDYCHVQTNFAADDKPAKVLARKMIQMVHTDNEQFLTGVAQVQCFTCHRGQSKPQVAPAIE